jgi:hypothetical protein
MFQWWKNRKTRSEKKLKEKIGLLEEVLGEQVILEQIRTKQYNDHMVKAEQRARKYKKLLEEEKNSNGKLLEARVRETRKLKEELQKLVKEAEDLKSNNDLLRQSLGHF